jgi:hypothetical protein
MLLSSKLTKKIKLAVQVTFFYKKDRKNISREPAVAASVSWKKRKQ